MRVVVAAWVGSDNLGDELIFSGLVRKLRGRGAHVVVPSLRPGATESRHPGVRAIGHLDMPALHSALGQADALVFGGGGLLQNETSWFNLPYHLSRVCNARMRGTPFAAVGIGAGRLRGAFGPAIVRASLRGARGVAARDLESVELLRRIGVATATLAADLALSLPRPAAAPEDRIVACLRPWTGQPGRLPVALRSTTDLTTDDMVTRLAARCDEAARRLGLPVRFVAFQTGWDDALHRRVAERMTAPVEAIAPDLDDVLDEVARSRVVVAMRYHAAIAALLAGRPAVLLGYAPKVDALAGAFGDCGRLVPWTPEGLPGLGTAVETVAVAGADPGSGDTLAAALARLRDAEAGNDRVLDDLLDRR